MGNFDFLGGGVVVGMMNGGGGGAGRGSGDGDIVDQVVGGVLGWYYCWE